MPAVAQVGPLSVPEKAPAQSEKEQLYHLLDDLRAAIRHDDWAEAWRLRIQLDTALDLKRRSTGQISPELELAHVELMAGRDATTRTPLLPRLAKTAYAARRYDKAEIYANEALAASKQGVFWWTGDAIHQGNIVLGRIALLRADVPTAIGYLLAAGKTPGSSTLNTTGPNMGLARDLLNSGQTDPVVQYLEECRAFWKADRGKLLEWLALVRAGLKPDFGPNLDY
ncbi:MAG: hypothetical protein LAQ30_18105 [Acidobacteriia bacterium]|nr:hypothetical protein [Terriglobia bacterium]